MVGRQKQQQQCVVLKTEREFVVKYQVPVYGKQEQLVLLSCLLFLCCAGATRLFVVRNLGLYGILLLFCLRQVALLPAVHGLRVVQMVQLVQLRKGVLLLPLRLENPYNPVA